MTTEIEVEGVGTMRRLNDWQNARLDNMVRARRHISMIAFSLGMTVHQFKQLSPEQQEACRKAFDRLTAPPPMNWEKRSL